MAYKMSDVGGWGTGALGDITNPAGQINSYANVTAISTNTVTIGTPSAGIYETFAVGKEILLHVSAVLSGTDATKLGKYLVATITGVSGSVLTLSKDVSGLISGDVLATHHVQAITVAQFGTLTLSSGSITPPVYSTTNKYGGVIALKCKTELVFSGGKIDLVDKGIPTASKAMRPLTAQETNMTTLINNRHQSSSGWENHITSQQFLLNSGYGAAMIFAKKTTISSTASRIGGTAAGVAKYPYDPAASMNAGNPSAAIGGSTILFASETISGFVINIISKGTNSSGAGYGRCYIASETKLPLDAGLYAADCLSNPARLRTIGIRDFGSGVIGNVTNPTGQINSYAPVTAINGNQVTIGTASTGVYGGFEAGTQVLFHASAIKATCDNSQLGKMFSTEILSVNGSVLTLAAQIPFSVPIANYHCQLVTLPNYANLTIGTEYTSALTWNNTSKIGGILAIKAKGTFDLSGGTLNMVGKGLPKDDAQRPVLPKQQSGQQGDYLPISQGNGAVFIVAKTLTMSASSKIGGTWTSTTFAGGGTNASYAEPGAIVAPEFYSTSSRGGGTNRGGTGPLGGNNSYNPGGEVGQSGTRGLTTPSADLVGYGGSSVFIVADTLDGFVLPCTGGMRGDYVDNNYPWQGGVVTDGGAGYGGSGGMSRSGTYGTGGGGPGSCFVYANTVNSPDYTGAVI